MDYQIIDEKVLGKTVGSDGSFTQMKRMHIVCDTVSGIPEPEPAWSAGSRCDVLADGGSVYQLSTEREWKPVNFYNRGGGGGGGFVPENYYTKTQTDTRITEKVAEIVNNAPEDFDTLKEMSDWIASHEESAAAMNTAIQGKVDKVTGKVLSDNNYTTSEKTKLAGLENYDDSAVRSEIAICQQSIGTRCMNLVKIGFTATTVDGVTITPDSDGSITLNGTRSGTNPTILVSDLASNANAETVLETRYTLPTGTYLLKGTGNDNVRVQLRCHDGTNGVTLSNSTNDNKVTLDGTYPYCFFRIWAAGSASFDNFKFYPMFRLADIADDSFGKYQPSLQEQIDELKARVTALGG